MKIYGPYTRKDGRKHVILYENGNRTTVSYPKYLMEQYLARKLLSNETVDHINRDFTDDRIENLQILTKNFHSKIDGKRAKKVRIVCVRCGKAAYKNGSDIRGNSKQGKAGPFCTRSCAGKYSQEVQMGKPKLPPQAYRTTEYFYLPKLASNSTS